MELVRSFIAIELPEDLKKDLVGLQNTLKSRQQDYVKWVEPENMHLTLKFLGEVPAEKIPEILDAMSESARNIRPFSLSVKGMGVFPSLKRIQVIWVGLVGDIVYLKNLQKSTEENLTILGFPSEQREFTPHLTLGRVKYQPPDAERDRLIRLITTLNYESKQIIQVSTVNLMKSILTSKGPVYSKLGYVSLSGT